MKRFIHTTKVQHLTNVSSQLKTLPQTTGSGPFISYPHFTPLNPLLSITLPSRTVLNLRNETNILALNGELNDIRSDKKIIKIGDTPLIFNQIYSEVTKGNGLSLILSNGNKNNFVNVEIEGREQSWIINNKKNLIGWYGGDLKIEPQTNKNQSIQFETGPLTTKSNIILANDTQLFSLDLAEGEVINLHSPSIVAYSTTTGSTATTGSGDVNIIEYPRFPKFDVSVKYIYSLVLKIGEYYQKLTKILSPKKEEPIDTKVPVTIPENSTILPPYVRDWIDYVQGYIYSALNPTYVEFKGPAKIVISNQK
ncbi:hypothetical protein WICPIJ_004673 [Wickerhamomyces pijperi]|uniref:Altered inheritance of mitochondria protein 24, mitochondrial n=1 Tax=Wickerhamomyces pijperi TaxID=599730 RepID=A0A9P8Q5E4_WICPI|nr:hypothetical protein WICPIJ_004673 [Wickerhamomyces pijperi]